MMRWLAAGVLLLTINGCMLPPLPVGDGRPHEDIVILETPSAPFILVDTKAGRESAQGICEEWSYSGAKFKRMEYICVGRVAFSGSCVWLTFRLEYQCLN